MFGRKKKPKNEIERIRAELDEQSEKRKKWDKTIGQKRKKKAKKPDLERFICNKTFGKMELNGTSYQKSEPEKVLMWGREFEVKVDAMIGQGLTSVNPEQEKAYRYYLENRDEVLKKVEAVVSKEMADDPYIQNDDIYPDNLIFDVNGGFGFNFFDETKYDEREDGEDVVEEDTNFSVSVLPKIDVFDGFLYYQRIVGEVYERGCAVNNYMDWVIGVRSYEAPVTFERLNLKADAIVEKTKAIGDAVIYVGENADESKLDFENISSSAKNLTEYEIDCNNITLDDELSTAQYPDFAATVREKLDRKYGKRFAVYVCLIDKSAELRFHTYRENDGLWLDRDLDKYDNPVLRSF